MQYNNLEHLFIKDNIENGRINVVCGEKGGGKSHIVTQYIAYALLHGIYDEIHAILPEFNSDNNKETYKFLKGRNDVFVYSKFANFVLDELKQKSKKKKINVHF